jgi:autotransporter-associated beta strand protein
MKPKHAILPLVLTFAVSSVDAADGSWNVTGGGDWGTAGNWTPGVADGTGFTATFGNVITANSVVNLDSARTIGNITASDTSQNYTISGANILTLDVSTGKPIIDVITSRTLLISSEIQGNDGLQKNGAGTLQLTGLSASFSGNIDINAGTLRIGDNNTNSRLGAATYVGNILNNGTLWFTNNDTQELSGIISGSGVLNKGGQGTLTLSGANTYTGKTIIAGSGAGGPGVSVSSFNSVNGGTPLLTSSSLGAPTTVDNGTIQFGTGTNQRSSTLTYTGSGETTDRVMDVRFNAGAKHTISNTGDGLLNFTSNFTITPSSGTTGGGLTLRGSGDGQIAQMGTIPGILEKADAGKWTIGGTNQANSVTVTGGKLLVNGTMNVTTTVGVSSGATLGGSGTVGGAITVNNGGTLSPGNSAGQFNVSTSLALAATSNTFMELGGTTLGTGFDNVTIDVAGALTYGGNLSVVNLGLYDMDAASFTYDLFSLGATTGGSFASVTVNSILLSNSGGLWTGINGDVNYSFAQSTGDLTVTVIPEPAAALLGGLGVLALLRRRRA